MRLMGTSLLLAALHVAACSGASSRAPGAVAEGGAPVAPSAAAVAPPPPPPPLPGRPGTRARARARVHRDGDHQADRGRPPAGARDLGPQGPGPGAAGDRPPARKRAAGSVDRRAGLPSATDACVHRPQRRPRIAPVHGAGSRCPSRIFKQSQRCPLPDDKTAAIVLTQRKHRRVSAVFSSNLAAFHPQCRQFSLGKERN